MSDWYDDLLKGKSPEEEFAIAEALINGREVVYDDYTGELLDD